MRWVSLMAAAAIVAAGPAARAAEPEAAPGVLSYPPSFFAEVGPSNALDMVMRVPGFTFDKGAVVRGLEGSGGNVLIDGQVPVSKNDTLDEMLKRIPASSVARVDVIRGGAPGIDMQGKTVVANVVRKSAAGFHGALQSTAQFIYDNRVLTGGRFEGQWRWNGKLLEMSAVYGHGPNDQIGDGPRVRITPAGTVLIRSQIDGDAAGERKWLIGAFETPLSGGRLRLNGAYMPTPASVEITDRLSVPGGKEYEYDTIDKMTGEFGARYTHGLGGKSSLEAVFFQQWNNEDTKAAFTSPAVRREFEGDKKITETVGRLNLRRRQSPILTLETYVEGAFNALESRTTLAQNGVRVRLPAANVRVEEKRLEASGQATLRVTNALTAELQMREETSTISSSGDVALQKSLSFTKPRFALTWSPDPVDQFRLRLEREVSQLNFDDFTSSSQLVSTGALLAGNPDLSPQQAWVIEVAAERRFWASGAAILTLRHYQLTDVIDRAPIFVAGSATADGPANIGDGTKDEVTASLAIPLDRFGLGAAQLKGQATWRRSEVTDPTTGRKREISILHPVDWEAHFTQDLPRLKGNWGVDVTGGYRERAFRLTEIETKKIGTWVVAFIETKPRPDIILRAEFQNVGQRDAKRVREVYAGSRALNALTYTDYRDLHYGQMLLLRVRKIL
jgi:outer membrane receptor protein involved in Fe transport